MHSKNILVSLRNVTDTELDLEIKIYDRVILQYVRDLFVHRCDKATQCWVIPYHVLSDLIKKVGTDTPDFDEKAIERFTTAEKETGLIHKYVEINRVNTAKYNRHNTTIIKKRKENDI